MRCPFCSHDADRVLETREARDGREVRRRRECLGCSRRFTTYERLEVMPSFVIKHDGRREPFDRAKLLIGLSKAAEKRPVPRASLEEIADTVEARLAATEDRELSTVAIGDLVGERLRDLDQVAYVRFASVYRRFEDVSEFAATLRQLEDD